jgi:hypothetical protein
MEELEKFVHGLRTMRKRINDREREIATMSEKNREDCALFWNTVEKAQQILDPGEFEDLELLLGIQGWDSDL